MTGCYVCGAPLAPRARWHCGGGECRNVVRRARHRVARDRSLSMPDAIALIRPTDAPLLALGDDKDPLRKSRTDAASKYDPSVPSLLVAPSDDREAGLPSSLAFYEPSSESWGFDPQTWDDDEARDGDEARRIWRWEMRSPASHPALSKVGKHFGGAVVIEPDDCPMCGGACDLPDLPDDFPRDRPYVRSAAADHAFVADLDCDFCKQPIGECADDCLAEPIEPDDVLVIDATTTASDLVWRLGSSEVGSRSRPTRVLSGRDLDELSDHDDEPFSLALVAARFGMTAPTRTDADDKDYEYRPQTHYSVAAARSRSMPHDACSALDDLLSSSGDMDRAFLEFSDRMSRATQAIMDERGEMPAGGIAWSLEALPSRYEEVVNATFYGALMRDAHDDAATRAERLDAMRPVWAQLPKPAPRARVVRPLRPEVDLPSPVHVTYDRAGFLLPSSYLVASKVSKLRPHVPRPLARSIESSAWHKPERYERPADGRACYPCDPRGVAFCDGPADAHGHVSDGSGLLYDLRYDGPKYGMPWIAAGDPHLSIEEGSISVDPHTLHPPIGGDVHITGDYLRSNRTVLWGGYWNDAKVPESPFTEQPSRSLLSWLNARQGSGTFDAEAYLARVEADTRYAERHISDRSGGGAAVA